VAYAQRLLNTFPEELDTVFFVNSGSEANDLALRLARAFTGNVDVLVLGAAYHGHTSSLIEVSPYKYEGKGGFAQRPHVHKVAAPDTYRGPHKGFHAGSLYAEEVRCVELLRRKSIQARWTCRESTCTSILVWKGSRSPMSQALMHGLLCAHCLSLVLVLCRGVCKQLVAEGRAPAAFMAESILGCGGQLVLPQGYFQVGRQPVF
jgi:4-aminobutyrate aminotransferase-like enzyme